MTGRTDVHAAQGPGGWSAREDPTGLAPLEAIDSRGLLEEAEGIAFEGDRVLALAGRGLDGDPPSREAAELEELLARRGGSQRRAEGREPAGRDSPGSGDSGFRVRTNR